VKEILDRLIKEGLVFKEFREIKLKTRKKIKVFLGVNVKNEYCLVVVFEKKSRVLRKDVEDILPLIPKINFRYKKKILLAKDFCSKVKEFKDWRVIWF